MRRASGVLLLLLTITLAQVIPAAADTPRFFNDVPAGMWYAGPVMKLWRLGILAGNDQDLRFRPDDPITRAEFVKILVLSDGLVASKSQCLAIFQDLPCGHWATHYVELAYRLYVVDGVEPGRFDPGGLVTREQMVTMLERALGRTLTSQWLPWSTIAAALTPYSDAGAVHDWAQGAMALAIQDKVFQGVPGGRLDPQRRATRAEAAALLVRAALPHYQRQAATTVDGHNLTYSRALPGMRTTAYSSDEPGLGDTTYSGLRVRPGIAAVDPSVIPLGSLLYVEGYGYAIAADTGSAIRGMRVDLYVSDGAQADAYGVQRHSVYIIEPIPPTAVGSGV